MMNISQRLLRIFEALLMSFGKRYWWPGESQLEIALGAILTQNTAWSNVEKAIQNLRNKSLLDVKKLYEIDTAYLGEIIKPSGFFNIKSKRLKNFVKLLYEEYSENINNLEKMENKALRKLLLSIDGIGFETADSIMLYALNKPIFVVDAYTKRFLKNHKIYSNSLDYHEIQNFFMDNLPHDIYLFNEFHALIVYLCQHYCKKMPNCTRCPLQNELRSWSTQNIKKRCS
jgi:endonuclease III related protein